MPDAANRLFIVKRLLIAAAALVAFVMASVIGSRIAVESLFKGIASSRATGLPPSHLGILAACWRKAADPLTASFLCLPADHGSLVAPSCILVPRTSINSLVEGVGAIFSSFSLFIGVLFEFGLPLLFWAALLFVPGRLAWGRYRHTVTAVPAAE